ncbi:RNA polymerase II transcription factor SIII subunit A-domain-containing protein [Cubamyces lactineus]|nr:RNA polymerase II transcription factor SIII subunit A-domain-containing protein [Cubamyces lactineus]
MSSDPEPGGRRLPSLVQYCQRVASTHANSFERLGEGLPEELLRPILNSCSAETLWRFEEEDPYIAAYTTDIWRNMCLKTYPRFAREPEESGSESWKDEFARCKEEDEQRLERAAAKLREKRQLDEERRKETSIKITDKLPPAKRARWGVSPSPKTLFQKTRSETAKLQKGVFSTRMTRPSTQRRPIVRNYAGASTSARPPPPPLPPTSMSSSIASGSRVTVRAVAVPRKPPPAKQALSTAVNPNAGRASSALSPPPPSAKEGNPPQMPSSPPDGRPPPPLVRPPPKKNPASTLFMPKHHAYSQLPRGLPSKS